MSILMIGWVNPSDTATPLTGYRKRAVSASELGAIHDIVTRRLPAVGAFSFWCRD
jgi:hypothetical protein